MNSCRKIQKEEETAKKYLTESGIETDPFTNIKDCIKWIDMIINALQHNFDEENVSSTSCYGDKNL